MKNLRSKGLITGLALLMGATMISTPALADDSTETRDVPVFSRVVVEGAMDINIRVGERQKLEVSTDQGYLNRVETRVEDDTLFISQEGRRWRDIDVEIELSVENLTAFIIEGAADAEIDGIDSETFLLEIDGAGDVSLTGECGDAEYEINGAGDVDAEGFECKTVEITINGAGDADVYASESIRAVLNGVGDITVYGNPGRVRPSIHGLGSFEVVDD
jgi:hypothetical protein